MRILRITLCLTLVMMLLFTSACTKQVTDTQKKEQTTDTPKKVETPKLSGTIKIGAAFSQTGAYAGNVMKMYKGLEFAVAAVNNSGILDDAKIELVLADSGSDTAMSINAFQKLINQDKVKFIYGPASTQQAMASDPLAQQAKVMVLGANTISITPIGDYIHLIISDLNKLIPNAVEQVVKARNVKTAVILTPKDYEAGVVAQKTRRETLQKLGIPIVIDEQYLLTDTDFTALITKIITKNPDIVFTDGATPADPLFYKQLKRAGYKGSFMGGTGTSVASGIAADPEAMEGQLNLLPWMAGASGENEKTKQYVADYKKAINLEPDHFTVGYYDSLFLLAQSIKKVGNANDVEAIRQQFNTIEIDGLQGKYRMGPDRVTNISTGAVVEVKNGKFVPLSK